MTAPVPPGHAFFLVGPTASGKTDAAHQLALELGCDILSADSMLVYRGMDIGTAKPDAAQRREVRYWGLDMVDPGAPFSLAFYEKEAAQACAENAAKGHGLIVAGGTGLYVKALLEGFEQGPPPDLELRNRWEARVKTEGVEPLRREVRQAYPHLAASLSESDLGNPRRLMRALELGAGGVDSLRRGSTRASDATPVTGLSLPSPLLQSRIERRVRRMYHQGFLEEVRRLMEHGMGQATTARQAIGYAEAVECLGGRLSVPEAQALTIKRTWQLARRQMTWFRHQTLIQWIPIEEDLSAEEVAARVRLSWTETGPIPLRVA
jgi:tRNA dimethylallyltransferase